MALNWLTTNVLFGRFLYDTNIAIKLKHEIDVLIISKFSTKSLKAVLVLLFSVACVSCA